MANYNLTNQDIKDTFQQLAQVSGSIEGGVSGSGITDGTGSRVTNLHVTASNALDAISSSYALTASFAQNVPTIDTGSFLITASNIDATITYTQADGSTFVNVINNVANADEAKDLVITVKNTSGGTLSKGTAVHAVDVSGENVDVIAASNDSSAEMPAIGVLSQDINNNASGTCIIAGRLSGINTIGLTAGASVFVGTNGNLTGSAPTGNTLIQNIGTAAKINASDGELIIAGAGRVNALPNLTNNYLWKGDSNGVPQEVTEGSLNVNSALTATSSSYALSASYAVSASVEIIKEVSSSYADFAQTAESASHALQADNSFSGSYASKAEFLNTIVDNPYSGGEWHLLPFDTLQSSNGSVKPVRSNGGWGFFAVTANNTSDGLFRIKPDGGSSAVNTQMSGSLSVSESINTTGDLNMQSGDIDFTDGTLSILSNGGNVLSNSGNSTSLYGSRVDIRNASNIFIRTEANDSGGIQLSSAQVKVLGDSSPSASLRVDGDLAGTGALALEVKSTITSQSVDIQGGTRFSGSIRALGGQIQLGDTGSGNSIDIPENGTAVVKGSTDFQNGAFYFGDQLNFGGSFNSSGGGSTVNLVDGTDIQIKADMNLSASKQLIGTASYAMFAETTSGTITNAATASYINPLTQSVGIEGSLAIDGSLTSSGSSVNLFQDAATGSAQLQKSLEFSENTSNRGNTYESNYIGMMNYNGFGDTFDKSLTMWKGNNALTEYGFIYNNGNTMGQYMVNVSGSFAHQRLYTDHGGSGDANYAVTADQATYSLRDRFSVTGTSAFTDILIGRDTVSSFRLVTDQTNALQLTGSLDVTGDLAISGISNVSASIAAAGGGAAFPFTGSASISGSLLIDGEAPNLDINTSVKGGTPNLRMYQAYNGTDVKFANISINDSTGTYTSPSLFGRFSNAVSAFGNAAGDPFTVIAGGAAGGAFNHWGLVLDQTGDIKSLKEMNMYSGAKVSGSLVVTGSQEITGSLKVTGDITGSANLSIGAVDSTYLTSYWGIETTNGNMTVGQAVNPYFALKVGTPTAPTRLPGIQIYTSASQFAGQANYAGVNIIDGDYSASFIGNKQNLAGSGVVAPANEAVFVVQGGATGDSIVGNNTIFYADNISGSPNFTKTTKFNRDVQVTGSLNTGGTINAGASIVQTAGTIQALGGNGGNGITIGSAGYGLQYPSMNVFTDSASYAASGGVYASHRIEDRGTGDFGTFALSTFNASDPGNLALEVQYNNDIVWWISDAQNRFHIEKELKAKAGAQITGSVDITGSLSLNGTPITGGGGSAFPFVGDAEITGSLNISGSTTGNIATPPLTSSGGTGFHFTASLDFNQASFFNIALDNGSTYHFKTYNAQPGQTVTLKVPQSPDGNGAVEFAPEFKFPGGNTPVATQGTGAEDIYTFVTFDTGSVYTVQTPGLA